MADLQAGRVLVRIAVNASAFNRSMQRATRRLDNFGRRAREVGRALRLSLAFPLAGASVAIVKFSSDFEATMVKIETLVGVNRQTVAAWSEDLLDLGVALGKGPNELADALFFITSAGFRGQEAIDALTASAKASAVGLGETKEVALALAGALNTFGKSGLTAGAAADILSATVRKGNVEASSIAATFGRVNSLMRSAGGTFADVGAFVAAFTLSSVKADEAVTSLRGTLNTFFKQTTEGKEILSELELTTEDLRKSVGEQGLARTLVKLVEDLEALGGEAVNKVIPNIRALAGVLAVTGENGEKFIDISDEIANSLGLVDRQFERTKDTAKFGINVMLASIQKLAVNVGKVLLPEVLKLADSINKFAKEASDADRKTVGMVIAFGALALVLSPLLITLGIFLSVTSFVVGGIASVAAGFISLAAAGGPIGIAVAALATVAASAGVAAFILGETGDRAVESARKIPLIGDAIAITLLKIKASVAQFSSDIFDFLDFDRRFFGFASRTTDFAADLAFMAQKAREEMRDIMMEGGGTEGIQPFEDLADTIEKFVGKAGRSLAELGSGTIVFTDNVKEARKEIRDVFGDLADDIAVASKAMTPFQKATFVAIDAIKEAAVAAKFTSEETDELVAAFKRMREDLSKVETKESLKQNADQFAALADSIMVARGEMKPFEAQTEQLVRTMTNMLDKLGLSDEKVKGFTDKLRGMRDELEEASKTVIIDIGDKIAGGIEEIVTGILRGTRKLGDGLQILSDIATAVIAEMFAEMIREKIDWEEIFEKNIFDFAGKIGKGLKGIFDTVVDAIVDMLSSVTKQTQQTQAQAAAFAATSGSGGGPSFGQQLLAFAPALLGAFGIPSFQRGGVVTGSPTLAMLHPPETVIPGVGPLFEVTIQNFSPEPVNVQRGGDQRSMDIVVGRALLRDFRDNGPVSQGLASSFGATRSPVRR